MNSGSPDPYSGLLTTTFISIGPPLQPLSLLPLLTILSLLPTGGATLHFILGPVNGQDCLSLTLNRETRASPSPSFPSSPEPGVQISIAELLASGDRVLSKLCHMTLWQRAGSRCSLGYFWKHVAISGDTSPFPLFCLIWLIGLPTL